MRLWLLELVILGVPMAFADVSGHWEGSLAVPRGPSAVALDVARDNHGAWTASLGVPERKISGLIVADLSVDGDKVKFSVPDVPGNPAFDLTLREGKLAGTLSMQGQSLPLEMQRTGEAKVDIVAPSPAVSSELEGDWEGALALPGGQSRQVMFHFRNLPDHTVSATIDRPGQGARGLSLSGVIQKGSEVGFSVRIFGGSFKGNLNAEGNQLTGEWVQSPGDAPLACQMKKK